MLHEEARKKLCPFQQASCSPHMCMMWAGQNKDDTAGVCLIREQARLATIPPVIRFQPVFAPIPVHLSEAQKAALKELGKKLKDGAQPGTVAERLAVLRPAAEAEVMKKAMPEAEARAVLEEEKAKQVAAKAEKKKPKKPAPRRRSAKKKQK